MTDTATTAVTQAETAIKAVKTIIKHPNTWVANITTAVASVVAIIALFHPGFKEPAAVQTALSTAAASGAILTQVVHFATRRIMGKP
jgi:hypothetical protein